MTLGLPLAAIELTAPAAVFALTVPGRTVGLPDGVSANRIVAAGEKGAEMAPCDRLIAGHTPVIITGATAGAPLLLTIEASAEPTEPGANLLRGTCVALTAPEPYYLLGSDNRFRRCEAATVIPANAAYILASDLPADTGSSFPLSLPDGIDEIHGNGGDGAPMPMYDLGGRPAKRGYVVTANGQKILVK